MSVVALTTDQVDAVKQGNRVTIPLLAAVAICSGLSVADDASPEVTVAEDFDELKDAHFKDLSGGTVEIDDVVPGCTWEIEQHCFERCRP